MAALGAILKGLRRAVGRDLASAIRSNNLLFLVLLGKAAEALFVLFGLLLLFPLSADPLAKIPRSRLSLWPLSRGQRFGLRFASLAFSPVLWAGIIILLKTGKAAAALVFLGLAVAIHGVLAAGRQMARRQRHWDLLLDLPRIPGRLGGLARKNLREMLTLLDPYAALLLSAGGVAYRLAAKHPDPAAATIMGLLVASALSTPAQSLFGLEGESGNTRCRLLPVAGWEILLAKDASLLAILTVLVLPLDPLPGLTFGLVAIAAGHHTSVLLDQPQQSWRFANGQLPFGALQVGLAMVFGFLEHERGPLVLVLAAIAYAASVAYYGRRWERG